MSEQLCLLPGHSSLYNSSIDFAKHCAEVHPNVIRAIVNAVSKPKSARSLQITGWPTTATRIAVDNFSSACGQQLARDSRSRFLRDAAAAPAAQRHSTECAHTHAHAHLPTEHVFPDRRNHRDGLADWSREQCAPLYRLQSAIRRRRMCARANALVPTNLRTRGEKKEPERVSACVRWSRRRRWYHASRATTYYILAEPKTTDRQPASSKAL